MTTLAKDTIRKFGSIELMGDLPVVATDIIYMGAAVGQDSSGDTRPLVAGDPFRGFADEQCDNSTGAAAAARVSVKAKGHVWLTVTDLGDDDDVPCPVYASDDDTFTKTAAGNSFIGVAVAYDSVSGKALVAFEAVKPSAAIADASVAHALNATFSDTEAETALNALGTTVNSILAALRVAGIIKTAGA
jgi:hypothetical protein